MILQGFRNLAISPQHALPALGLQFPHHGMAAFRMPGHDQGEASRLARRFCDQNFLPVMRAGGQHYRLAAFQFVQNGGKLRISLPALRHLLVKFDASRHVMMEERTPTDSNLRTSPLSCTPIASRKEK